MVQKSTQLSPSLTPTLCTHLFGNFHSDNRCAFCESEVGRLMLRTSPSSSHRHRHHWVSPQIIVLLWKHDLFQAVNGIKVQHKYWYQTLIQTPTDNKLMEPLFLSMSLALPPSVALSLPFKESEAVRRVYPTVTCLLSRQERNCSKEIIHHVGLHNYQLVTSD